jgi:glyoxylase-like metal-dependent hydrolase (beta-lactamase superfamily II)
MSDYPVHVEIEPSVYLIRGENRARFPEANCILVDDEILTLVDAGASRRNITTTLRDLGHQMSDIERIVLTHFHVDHKGLAAEIQKEAECELICHPFAEEGVASFKGLIECYGIDGHRYFDAWQGLMKLRLPHVMGNYEVTGVFDDKKPISCGDVDLVPIHLPGHTHDHTCFGINGVETVLLVDIDLTRFGPWYGNKVSDIEEFKRSIRHLIEIRPKTGVSSHRLQPITDGLDSELRRYLRIIGEREERILSNIRRGYDSIQKLAQVPTIYPRIPYDLYMAFEELMLEKHVELFKKSGTLHELDGHLSIVDG